MIEGVRGHRNERPSGKGSKKGLVLGAFGALSVALASAEVAHAQDNDWVAQQERAHRAELAKDGVDVSGARDRWVLQERQKIALLRLSDPAKADREYNLFMQAQLRYMARIQERMEANERKNRR